MRIAGFAKEPFAVVATRLKVTSLVVPRPTAVAAAAALVAVSTARPVAVESTMFTEVGGLLIWP
jgi:hypothetical protein